MDEEGQSTTEYILMLAVAVMIAMKFKSKIIPQIDQMTAGIGQNMQSALDSGGGN
jgi:pilus assembly protein Flp/PilA